MLICQLGSVLTVCIKLVEGTKELDSPYPLDLFYSVHGHSKHNFFYGKQK